MSKNSVQTAYSQTDVVRRYYHPCVGVGLFVKEYIGTYGRGLVIKLKNGREWFAPINEFTLIQ